MAIGCLGFLVGRVVLLLEFLCPPPGWLVALTAFFSRQHLAKRTHEVGCRDLLGQKPKIVERRTDKVDRVEVLTVAAVDRDNSFLPLVYHVKPAWSRLDALY